MINALVTGSRKYGSPRCDSDVDVVLLVSHETFDDLWSQSTEDGDSKKCIFDQVCFVQTSVDFDRASVVWGMGYVDVYCDMSEADRDLLGGLRKWEKVEGSQAFASTLRNDIVNLVPVVDPDVWAIWSEGTEVLAASGKIVDREDAIDFLTLLGMPRFDS